MQLTALLDAVGAHPGFDELPNLGANLRVVSAAHPWLVAAAAKHGQVLAVTATTREAEDLYSALCSLLEPAQCGLFPAWETLPHERLSPSQDTVEIGRAHV